MIRHKGKGSLSVRSVKAKAPMFQVPGSWTLNDLGDDWIYLLLDSLRFRTVKLSNIPINNQLL